MAAAILVSLGCAAETKASTWLDGLQGPQLGFTQFGGSPRVRATTLGLAWDLPWSSTFEGGRFISYAEVSIARWVPQGPRTPTDPSAFTRFGVTPVLR